MSKKAANAPLPKGQKTLAGWFTKAPGKPKVDAAPATGNNENVSPGGTAAAAKKAAAAAKKAAATAAAVPPNPATTVANGKAGSSSQKASPAATGPSGESAVGWRLRVLWPDDERMYGGQVVRYNTGKEQHLVRYDDGDEEWLALGREKIEWVGDGQQPVASAATKGKAGSKRRVVLESDDEDEGEEEGESGAESDGSDWEAEVIKSGAAAAEDDDDDDDVELEDEVEEMDEDGDEDDEGALGGGKTKGGSKATPKTPSHTAAKRKLHQERGLEGSQSKRVNVGFTPVGRTAGSSAASAQTPWTAPAAGRKAPGSSSVFGSAPCTAPVKSKPRSALKGSTAPDTPGLQAGATESSGEERWEERVRDKFPFLLPDNIRDASGRRPSDPDYDPRTLKLPNDWFKKAKISPGQQQWWEFKSKNFDSVLLFKMGKFYEIFEMDAAVGQEVLGLQPMRDERPHCGFPEANYHQHAETLARAGLRVVVVEQTETPDLLKTRVDAARKRGQPILNVVRRDVVAVLTLGTLTDAEMLASCPDASYLLALVEMQLPQGWREQCPGGAKYCCWMGAAAVDCATGQILVGQWYDDELRSRLRAQLAALQPVELVLPKDGLSGETSKVLRACLRSPRVNTLPVGGQDFWTWQQALEALRGSGYFLKRDRKWRELPLEEGQKEEDLMPHNMQMLCGDGEHAAAALHALGGVAAYLRTCLLDRRVLPLGRLHLLPGTGEVAGAIPSAARITSGGEEEGGQGPEHVTLDGAALENLEVLENSEGGVAGTLIAALDNCVTPSGRRLLKEWLTRPLFRVKDIIRRQQAVRDLMGPASDALVEARRELAGMADLERSLARMHAAASGVGCGRDAPNVILYEDTAGRKVGQLVAALKGLQTLQRAVQKFEGISSTLSSSLLQELVTPGGGLMPHMAEPLQQLCGAADWAEAERSARIVPHQGMDDDYDAAMSSLRATDAELKEYLAHVRAEVGDRSIAYISLNKDSHVMEVTESTAKRMPGEYELVGQRKGFKRYLSTELRRLVRCREEAAEAKEVAMAGAMQALQRRFVENSEVWRDAVAALAQLDVLGSLAVAATLADGEMCAPKFVEGPPCFRATALRHPAGINVQGGTFVPNDIKLGGDQAPFILLTGPNMGGKSTLLRQVCQSVLLAQVGALVPAASLELSPVDCVFVRMGARDDIMSGQSTFFVELSETAMMLNRATERSLVALDELGRGTATADGAAIAAAVLQHMSHGVRCLGMFATHYHRLSDLHAGDPAVAIKHMACAVAPGKDGVDRVTFLYKLASRACPKSYGTNVARLAGLPGHLVTRAAQVAADLEGQYLEKLREKQAGKQQGNGDLRQQQQPSAVQLMELARQVGTAAAGGDAGALAALAERVRAAGV